MSVNGNTFFFFQFLALFDICYIFPAYIQYLWKIAFLFIPMKKIRTKHA